MEHNLAHYIEHTLLKADSNSQDVAALCDEALLHGFHAVCISPYFVKEARARLKDRPCKVVTVIGFPMGYSATAAKVEEIKRAFDEGADEVDVVINLNAVRSGHWSFVENDIASVTRAAHLKGKTIKIILESGLLDEASLTRLCMICAEAEVDFVKTATGLLGPGADEAQIRFLRQHLPTSVKIKASGGIRTAAQAAILIAAGAQRIGSSAGVAMLQEA